MWGATTRPAPVPATIWNFNPRSPCGERRLFIDEATQFTEEISIHAPRVGSDCAWEIWFTTRTDFNPRSPCGERRRWQSSRRSPCKFQSTLPVWGATARGYGRSQKNHISIHAPRVGSDRQLRKISVQRLNFNPCSPCGERPINDTSKTFGYQISIHAPRVGSDNTKAHQNAVFGISIHAPRVGSDFFLFYP